MLTHWHPYSVTGCRNHWKKLKLGMAIVGGLIGRPRMGVSTARDRDSRHWLVIVVDTED